MGNSFKYILALFIFMVALCGRQKFCIFDTNAIYKSHILAAHQSSSFQMYLEENGKKYIILRSEQNQQPHHGKTDPAGCQMPPQRLRPRHRLQFYSLTFSSKFVHISPRFTCMSLLFRTLETVSLPTIPSISSSFLS